MWWVKWLELISWEELWKEECLVQQLSDLQRTVINIFYIMTHHTRRHTHSPETQFA